MILNNFKEAFEYEGKKFFVGQRVFVTDGDYRGLYGNILEIRDGEDKETENESPDVYCEFYPPVLPCEIEDLEKRFSDLYQSPKKLEDISLDLVIVAPDEIIPLRTGKEQKLALYKVCEEWIIDGELGADMTIHADIHSAKEALNDVLFETLTNSNCEAWKEKEDFMCMSTDRYYECWLDDSSFENRYKVCIEEFSIPLADSVFATLGEKYMDQSLAEDFAEEAAQREELSMLPKEECKQFLSDPSIPDRVRDSFGNFFWKEYWSCISDAFTSLLKEFRENPKKNK